MKTLKNKFWALLLITSVAFLSCKKQDPLPVTLPNSTSSTSTNNPTFTKGDWRIELFKEDSIDKTINFRGYLFTFSDDGTVLAKKSNETFSGTWFTVKESDRMKFLISFPSSPLSEINGDWSVKNESYTSLKLEHVSGGDESIKYLTFGRYFAQADAGNTN